MKKALLLCTSHNDLGLIRSLRKLGYYIIATGNIENLPGECWVDKFVKADYSDKDLILSIARSENIDAICQCCNDFGVYTASYVAEKLNLPGYDTYENILTLHNKDKFKEFAWKYDLVSPKSESFENIDSAMEAIRGMDFPVIVKPTDASAGNGISKIGSCTAAEEAVEEAFRKSRLKKIVVEPYIEGTQHGFCTFLVDRKVVAYCTNNEYSIINPYSVEIDTFPADGWKDVCELLIGQIERIAEILNLKDGIFHLQYIMSNRKPWILEVMRRVPGNMYTVLANQLNGINWDYWETRAKCGLSCKGIPHLVWQEGCYAYKTVLADKNGRIKRILIPDNYKKYIFAKYMLKKEGDIISDYKRTPVGFLFMMFFDPEEMKRVLIDEYRCDMVEVED